MPPGASGRELLCRCLRQELLCTSQDARRRPSCKLLHRYRNLRKGPFRKLNIYRDEISLGRSAAAKKDSVFVSDNTAEVSVLSWSCPVSTQVNERGGKCVPVVCDSTKDNDIEAFFERIKQEEKGRLDILVNNAYAGVQVGVDNTHR